MENIGSIYQLVNNYIYLSYFFTRVSITFLIVLFLIEILFRKTLISKKDLSGKYLFVDDSKYFLLVVSKVNVKDIISGKIFFPSISSNINLSKKYYHTCFLEEDGYDFPASEPIEEYQIVHLLKDSNEYVKISSNMKHNQLPHSFKNISENTFNHWKEM